jgi:DNA-binding transcriptional ArsR family regulator
MNKKFDDDEDIKKSYDEEDWEPELQKSIREMKREFKEQMKQLKDELAEIKGDLKSDYSEREYSYSRRVPRQRKPKRSIHIDTRNWEDWGERFGESFEHYIGGILESVGDTIDRTVGSLFQSYPRYSRRRGRAKKKPYFVPEEELEEFYGKGSSIMSALSDSTRLKMLKELEKEPLRQSDLSLRTDTKGGNFKHHISILKEEGLVRQEGVRERYLLTFAGREALKLVEFLYSRSKRRVSVPVTISDEEEDNLIEEEE